MFVFLKMLHTFESLEYIEYLYLYCPLQNIAAFVRS